MNINVMWVTIVAAILIILVSIISQLRNEMARMKVTLDKIAKQVGVPDIVTEEVKDELRSLISQDKKIEAIKRYRMVTGLGLKESKEYIDQLSIQK